ncbi:hypothetical protein [Flavobacterium sp.]|uniref:hypothetical protein n=1 Tax=Flavobacterium sp. TaxID=239 RepID=UPI0039E27991
MNPIKIKLFLIALLLGLNLQAQVSDSIKKKAQAAITDRFPVTRTFDVQYQQYLPTDYESELYDRSFRSGEMSNHYRLALAANIPVLKRPKWQLTASANYRYEAFELRDTNTDALYSALPAGQDKVDFHYLSTAMSFTYYSTLFRKLIIYNASVIVDGSEEQAERVKGFAAATWIVKRNQQTMIGIGLLAFIDPTAQLPVLPTLAVEHHFKNSPWFVDVILPQRAMLKRPMFANGRLSIGTEINADNFYAYSNSPFFADTYDYRQFELKSGFTYEHHLSHQFIASLRAGISNVIASNIYELGQCGNNETLSVTPDPTGYFTLGFSYNPHFKSFKKSTK